MVSLVMSQSQILKRDVYLIQNIRQPSQGKMTHMIAIYFVRPTKENVRDIQQQVKNPRFKQYHLFFTNSLSHTDIEFFAQMDEMDLIKQIQEVYADYYVLNPDLFSLNIPSTYGITNIPSSWTSADKLCIDRITQGILSVLYSLRQLPNVRFLSNSPACEKVAVEIER